YIDQESDFARQGSDQRRDHATLAVAPQANSIGVDVSPRSEVFDCRQGFFGPVSQSLEVKIACRLAHPGLVPGKARKPTPGKMVAQCRTHPPVVAVLRP